MKVRCLEVFPKVLIPSLIILGHTMLYLSVHITGLKMALPFIVGKGFIRNEVLTLNS